MNSKDSTRQTSQRKLWLLSVLAVALSSCGGGGSNGGTTGGGSAGGGTGGSSSIPTWTPGLFETSSSFEALCESPRSGISAQTGQAFVDLSGSTLLENHWLRSWTDEIYLWYDEVIDRDPALYETPDYFELLKTNAVTGSGAAKDQFHFTVETAEYEALSQSGVAAGYGFQVTFLSSTAPYEIAIAYTEPGSPASTAGISRGARILSIDGVSAENPATQEEVDVLNAGLRPESLGEIHSFTIQDLGSSSSRTLNLTSTLITSMPVQNVGSIDTPTGKVGYILFNDHIATAESQLKDAFEQLFLDSVQDLVLDLRYNGGGFLAIASQVAYMIAGPSATDGEVFEALVFNDKNLLFDPGTGEANEPFPFLDETIGFSTISGAQLPSLNLPRVYILANSGTCSASESIINALRGVGIEVILIGDTTCGKPYGFRPADNCGTTYFSIQFQSENALGFSDYADGFSPQNVFSLGSVSLPGCGVEDDLDHVLGDPDEAMLAKALSFRDTGSCLASSKVQLDSQQQTELILTPSFTPKPEWLQNRILDMPNE